MNERDKTSTQKQPNEWRDVDFRSDAPDRPRPPGMPKPGPWRIAQGYQDDVELPALICGENEKEMTIVEECFDFYPGDVLIYSLTAETSPGHFVIVECEGRLYVRRFEGLDENGDAMLANCKYLEAAPVPPAEIVGRVCGHFRKLD